MGKGPLRLLAVWVFLSALFITSSLAAASSEGSVLCILRPRFPAEEIYIHPLDSTAPLYALYRAVGPYLCTDPIPPEHLSAGVKIRYIRPGASMSEYIPAELNILGNDRVRVNRLAYLENNSVVVVFVAQGVGYVAADENIPKSTAQTFSSIRGDVVFINPDPILRIYLRAERGKVDVRHYEIEGATEIPKTTTTVLFAPCSLRVAAFSAKLTRIGGKEYVAGRFKVVDSDGHPLLIPTLSVVVGDDAVSPQYSSATMEYVFFVPYDRAVDSVTISADVPGCSHFEHTEYISLERGNGQTLAVLVLLVAVLAAGAYFFKMRRR